MRTIITMVLFCLGLWAASCGTKAEAPEMVDFGDNDNTADDDTADDDTSDDVNTCTVLDNEDGTYTLSCSDGTTVTWADGQDGTDGIDGIDGTNGTDGVDGVNGTDGDDGLPGVDGVDGVNGTDGTDGEDGSDGADGADGEDGTDGTPAVDGIDGSDGEDGVDGADGTSCTGAIIHPMGCVVITCGGVALPAICPPPATEPCTVVQEGVCSTFTCPDSSSRICPACTANADCDDGNSCTVDTCGTDGVCASTAVAPATCDDGNSCTVDSCDSTAGCVHNAAAANGFACGDGNACNGGESCYAGACVAGTAVTCTALDACHTAGVCAPATGVCTNPTAPVGTMCDDADVTTTTDSCNASGECEGLILPPPSPDSDGDGWTVAQGDCDDDGTVGTDPARWCRGTDGKDFLAIAFGAAVAPACPAGSTSLGTSDGSALNNPGMHDTPGDGFDNDCDGNVDEGGASVCSWPPLSGVTNGFAVSCTWMNP